MLCKIIPIEQAAYGISQPAKMETIPFTRNFYGAFAKYHTVSIIVITEAKYFRHEMQKKTEHAEQDYIFFHQVECLLGR